MFAAKETLEEKVKGDSKLREIAKREERRQKTRRKNFKPQNVNEKLNARLQTITLGETFTAKEILRNRTEFDKDARGP